MQRQGDVQNEKEGVLSWSDKDVTVDGKLGSLMAIVMFPMGKESKRLPLCTLM
jgi:hypothetical protein